MQPALMVEDAAVTLAVAATGLALMAGGFHRVVLRANRRLRRAQDRAEAANPALHRELAARRVLEAALHARAYSDPLTGLPNRRQFFERAEAMLAEARAAGNAFAIASFDLDRFKSINDRLGHGAGDTALRAVADCAAPAVPAGGLLARFGGEEFALVLPGIDRPAAAAMAGRMRAAIAGLRLPLVRDAALRMSASFGIATMAEGDSLDRMLARADAAMYVAKRAGGDRVAFAADGA